MAQQERPTVSSGAALVPALRMLVMSGALWIASKLGFTRQALWFSSRVTQSARKKKVAFQGYQPTAHDVFVCTYSKSGTNWTMQITHQVAHRGHGEFANIHDVVPWPDAPMPGVISLHDETPARSAPTGLRVIKTHLESQYVPWDPDARYIVVVRDPKEAFVSSYFYSSGLLPASAMISVDEWLDMFLSDDFPYGSWAEHLASFWPWRQHSNVLFLTFGEMKDDLEGVVRRIADLMDVELSAEELPLVVERSSFDYMKRIDRKFVPPMPFLVRRFGRAVMMRKGERGNSSELLTHTQQARIDHHMQSDLRRHACDFPYEEIFVTSGLRTPMPTTK